MSLKDDKTPVPKMPHKGEVDFVFGGMHFMSCLLWALSVTSSKCAGPPCQSFSGANHFKVSSLFPVVYDILLMALLAESE